MKAPGKDTKMFIKKIMPAILTAALLSPVVPVHGEEARYSVGNVTVSVPESYMIYTKDGCNEAAQTAKEEANLDPDTILSAFSDQLKTSGMSDGLLAVSNDLADELTVCFSKTDGGLSLEELKAMHYEELFLQQMTAAGNEVLDCSSKEEQQGETTYLSIEAELLNPENNSVFIHMLLTSQKDGLYLYRSSSTGEEASESLREDFDAMVTGAVYQQKNEAFSFLKEYQAMLILCGCVCAGVFSVFFYQYLKNRKRT